MSPAIQTNDDRCRRSADGWAKPRQLVRGIIVALVGPDGVGKSSQTARLAALFQRDFECSAVYLGSGDGGWRFRRAVKQLFRKLRGRLRQSKLEMKSPTADPEFGTNHSLFTGLSGLLVAIERSVSLRRAMRLAKSGSIVICDRWPQNIQAGFFDGPLRLAADASWIVRMLSKAEHRLYRRMERFKPDLTIHLISDFETSNARKPGDRTPADFDRRLALMHEMRLIDRKAIIIDASRDFDEVTRDLHSCILRAVGVAT
jgi:thymidylate kinase